MDEKGNQATPEPQFRAVLTPHRSLSPTGFLILMSVLSGISFVSGIVFLTMGAWPVTGFFGLELSRGPPVRDRRADAGKIQPDARAPVGSARAILLQPLLGAGEFA